MVAEGGIEPTGLQIMTLASYHCSIPRLCAERSALVAFSSIGDLISLENGATGGIRDPRPPQPFFRTLPPMVRSWGLAGLVGAWIARRKVLAKPSGGR